MNDARATAPAAASSGIAAFAPLADFMALDAKRLPKTCIVTGELVGPFKNGGLGTSMTGLAELLGAFGADVTVLYTGEASPGDLPKWKQSYRDAGITLEALAETESRRQIGPLAGVNWTNALKLYDLLRDRAFDVIHFNDTVGEGVYCFIAKRLGLAFGGALLTLAVHSPTEWILEANGNEENWLGYAYFETAERLSIAAADLLWGPSRYLLDWIARRDYRLPARLYNQQYVIPTGELFSGGREKCARVAQGPAPTPPRRPKEIVFFGRLEERKGIRLFCAAVTRLGEELRRRGVSVLFMGKMNSVNGVPSDQFLASRSGAWPFAWRVESGFGQREAVAYLRDRDCVAVMASPVDNSPCTVYEALQFGVPFIAAATGGIPELVHPDDRARHLFDYRVDALCARLLDVLDHGVGVARPAIDIAANQARWLSMHADWKDFLPPPAQRKTRRHALVIDHASDAQELQDTLASARAALGPALCAAAIYRRDLVPLGAAAEALDLLFIDELGDMTPGELIGQFRAAGAEALLFLRSGAKLSPSAPTLLDRAFDAGYESAVPFAAIGGAVMTTLAASAAHAFLEGDFDVGAAAFSLDALARRLGQDCAALDRSRLYFGALEEMQARDATICPVPETLVALASAEAALAPLAAPAIRNRAFAGAPRREINQIIATARLAYRYVFPARPPLIEPGPAQAIAAEIVEMARRNDRLLGLGRNMVRAVAGDRGVAAVAGLVRRLRG